MGGCNSGIPLGPVPASVRPSTSGTLLSGARKLLAKAQQPRRLEGPQRIVAEGQQGVESVMKIDFAANFLCMSWNAELIQQATTVTELLDAMRQSISATTPENASSCSLLVIGAFFREYQQDRDNCGRLKAYLQTDQAFAAHRASNQFKQMSPAGIRRAIENGDLCGGAGYGYLLSSDDLARLSNADLGVGILHLSHSIDLLAWSDGLFGKLPLATLAVDQPKSNAYQILDTADDKCGAVEPEARIVDLTKVSEIIRSSADPTTEAATLVEDTPDRNVNLTSTLESIDLRSTNPVEPAVNAKPALWNAYKGSWGVFGSVDPMHR